MENGLRLIAALAVAVDARWVRLARVAARQVWQVWLEQVSVSPWSHCLMKRGCYAFGGRGGRGGCHGGSPFLTGDGWAGGGGGAGFCSGIVATLLVKRSIDVRETGQE